MAGPSRLSSNSSQSSVRPRNLRPKPSRMKPISEPIPGPSKPKQKAKARGRSIELSSSEEEIDFQNPIDSDSEPIHRPSQPRPKPTNRERTIELSPEEDLLNYENPIYHLLDNSNLSDLLFSMYPDASFYRRDWMQWGYECLKDIYIERQRFLRLPTSSLNFKTPANEVELNLKMKYQEMRHEAVMKVYKGMLKKHKCKESYINLKVDNIFYVWATFCVTKMLFEELKPETKEERKQYFESYFQDKYEKFKAAIEKAKIVEEGNHGKFILEKDLERDFELMCVLSNFLKILQPRLEELAYELPDGSDILAAIDDEKVMKERYLRKWFKPNAFYGRDLVIREQWKLTDGWTLAKTNEELNAKVSHFLHYCSLILNQFEIENGTKLSK